MRSDGGKECPTCSSCMRLTHHLHNAAGAIQDATSIAEARGKRVIELEAAMRELYRTLEPGDALGIVTRALFEVKL